MYRQAHIEALGALPAQGTETGSGLVELAMVLSVLVVVLVAIIALGFALNHYVVVCNASREGARYGSLYAWTWSGGTQVWSSAGIVQAVIDEGAGGSLSLTADNVTIHGAYATGGSPIRVTVDHQMPLMLGRLIGAGDELTISCSTEMVVLSGAP